MITKIVYFLRKLFGRDDIEDYGTIRSYPDVERTPARKQHKKSTKIVKPATKKVNKYQQKDNKLSTNIPSSTSHRASPTTQKNKQPLPTQPSPMINKAVLMRKIKTNIFFLEQLLEMLEKDPSYRSYYRKVREMKEQSEGCFKLVHRMKEDAPYFNNTLKTVLNHTNTVAQLLSIK